MSEAAQPVVWILGAGFSRSLGGPLLVDMLSHRASAETLVRYPRLDTPIALSLYERYARDRRGANGAGWWSDAEGFIEYVDSAALGNQAFRSALNLDAEEAARTVRRLIAAECNFADESDLVLESWQPYLRWASRELRPGDSLVTFNYDRVLERLGQHQEVRLIGEHAVVGVNAQPEVAREHAARIMKMHGSIDWTRTDGGFCRVTPHAPDGPDEPLIAAPGPSKRRMCEELLAGVWRQALECIKGACCVVFIGYRFPPSDAHARAHLLQALAQNESAQLSVHIVLGPRTEDESVRRLAALVQESLAGAGRRELGHDWQENSRIQRQAIRRFTLTVHPLYAEDFLTTMRRERLFVADLRIQEVRAAHARRGG